MSPYKIAIIVVCLIIIFSMGKALYHMVKGNDPEKMLNALTWRIGLSVGMIILIIIGVALGVIEPHNIYGQ